LPLLHFGVEGLLELELLQRARGVRFRKRRMSQTPPRQSAASRTCERLQVRFQLRGINRSERRLFSPTTAEQFGQKPA
jgi:hypothetical protein